MRRTKIIIGLVLLAACAGLTLVCYLQSHGAGISMGVLLTIVILSFLYDHGGHIFWGTPASRATRPRTLAMDLAMRQGRNDSLRGDVGPH